MAAKPGIFSRVREFKVIPVVDGIQDNCRQVCVWAPGVAS
jgi:hypothetical protein